MDILYTRGVSVIQYLQDNCEAWSASFQFISWFCDPKYAFLIWPPLIHALCWKSGRTMMLVVIICEWTNMCLKWSLLGHRPYWWVRENMKAAYEGDTIIRQFPLTCETGPGSPSGHAEITASVYFLITAFILDKVLAPLNLKSISSIFLWPAYFALVAFVSTSRLYIGAHFPHQCVLGALLGLIIAYTMKDMETKHWKRSRYILLTVGLYLGVMTVYYTLSLMGVNVVSTISRAQKWCANPAWVHIDTTPFFSMMRYLGFCLGMGLAVTCSRISQDGKVLAIHTKIITAVLCAVVGKMSEEVSLPFKDSPPIVFYATAFIYNTILSYVLFALIPFIVVSVIGGDKTPPKSTEKSA